MKTCVKCKTLKSPEKFHKDKIRPDGLFPYCKECRRIARKPRSKVYRRTHSSGYILLNIPDHPLVQKNGYVYEHRYVFYSKFAGMDLKCQKCGVDWLWRTYRDHIDHIDKNKSNNDISNLRPLCNYCNVSRTLKKRKSFNLRIKELS